MIYSFLLVELWLNGPFVTGRLPLFLEPHRLPVLDNQSGSLYRIPDILGADVGVDGILVSDCHSGRGGREEHRLFR